MPVDLNDVDIRVIDQRIGMGIGGRDTVIRAYHKPTGILVEMPKTMRSQFYDRQLALEMIEYALSEIGDAAALITKENQTPTKTTPSNMLWNAEQQMRGPTYATQGYGGHWYILHSGGILACVCSGTEGQMRAEIERIHKNHAATFHLPIWC